MKHTSSGLGVGLWAVGGLVGLYLLILLVFYVDEEVFKTFYLFNALPPQAKEIMLIIYAPVGWLLERIGTFP